MAPDTMPIPPSGAMVVESNEASASAVSWGAIIGGSVAAAASTLLLVTLGAGIGLSSVSPWSAANPTAATFTLMTAIWLIIVQWLSSGLGGYLAGRLRTKWNGLHTHEVFFRDTAHGFLAWALASVLVAMVTTSAISSAVSVAGSAVSSVAGGATQAAASQAGSSTQYFADSLFRADQPKPDASPQQATGEAGRILARSVASGNLDPGDRTYLAKLIAARAGLPQQDAEKRVDNVVAQMKTAEEKTKDAADAARKATAKAAFYAFFSMLIGAFIASAAGAIGGRERDSF
jgi:hypothetical protein